MSNLAIHRPLALAALVLASSGCAMLGGNVKGSFSCKAPAGDCAPTSVIDERATRTAASEPVTAEIQRLAREWAEVFDPNALLTLAIAAEDFDLRGQLHNIRAPLLMVMSRSDQVFSPALAREFAPMLSAAGVPWSYVELDSDKGHFASGADASLWSDTLRRFMDTPPEAWVSWGLQA